MSHRRTHGAWFVGVVWFLSWFELYLEIYRHHHVTPFFLPNPPSTAPGAQPGLWLRTALACSALAPPLFVALVLRIRMRRTGTGDSQATRVDMPFPIGAAAAIFGFTLSVLGTVNQLIWRPPIVVDLTLRTGNGGFIVWGVALALAGVMLRHLKANDGSQWTP